MGTRWSAGDAAPARLPEPFVTQITAVEQELPADEIGVARWTLTWLEGRPVAELDLGITVSLTADGAVHVEREDDAEDDAQL